MDEEKQDGWWRIVIVPPEGESDTLIVDSWEGVKSYLERLHNVKYVADRIGSLRDYLMRD